LAGTTTIYHRWTYGFDAVSVRFANLGSEAVLAGQGEVLMGDVLAGR